ncbi:MAG: GHMP kinase [Acidobacteria bacterium]|nr:MAG: GHMP kinase [Acidobacteriota bacterium]
MYRIAEGSTQGLQDAERFVETLNALERHPAQEVRALFDRETEIVLARAPGRLDVLGGIADYSGSLVLQLPTEEAALVALQRERERVLKVVSLRASAGVHASVFEMPLTDFERGGVPVGYDEARAYFGRDESRRWAAYVAGAFVVLMRERGASFEGGARLLVSSDVPEGRGVSSSAALEVATMSAVAAGFGVTLSPRETALLCQKVENLVVGAPCGVMDQMTAACGEPQRLLALLCQPAEMQGHVEVPFDVAFWGIDSGVTHSVAGAAYEAVRVGAFMGYRIIADLAGLKVSDAGGTTRVEDARWRGCLANLTPSEFEQHFAQELPKHLGGGEFLSRYGGTTDAVTRVRAERDYAVRTPTRHPINENFRVRAFAELLRGAADEPMLALLGELMYQSHASYSACGLGSAETDLIVRLVREAGPARGLYGAKITGGGSGGTVAVLGRRGSEAAVAEIAERYEQATGRRARTFSGSSPGAAAFGHLKLSRKA